MAESESEVLSALLKALQQKSDETDDRSMKQLFKEVRDELRTLNKSLSGRQEVTEREKEIQHLAKSAYPALQSRLNTPDRL